MSPTANPLPSKFQKLGRGLGKNAQRARTLPPPPTLLCPQTGLGFRPAWASDAGLGPALAHHYSKAPSPLPRNSIADWPPPAPEAQRGKEGGREGGWGGRDAPGACTDPGDSEGVLEPPSPLRFKWRGAGGDPAHPLEPGPPIFPRQGGGWLRTLDRP